MKMKLMVLLLLIAGIYLSFNGVPLNAYNLNSVRTVDLRGPCTQDVTEGDVIYDKGANGFPVATGTFEFDGCHYVFESQPLRGFINLAFYGTLAGLGLLLMAAKRKLAKK